MDRDAAPSLSPDQATGFAVLLFTDICDSTALKAQQGALVYRVAAELHNRCFEQLAAEEKLTLIKNTGDGYLARTVSVAAAVRFALRLQHALRVMPWPDFPLVTRVGIHAGEVADITTLGQTDVLAPAADLVARIMSLAVGGQILLSRWPFDEARHFVREHPAVESGGRPALTWLAHGPYLFKGCDDPVEIFEVGATDLAPLAAPPDAEKAKRAVRPGDEETLGWRPAIGLEVPGRADWRLTRKIGEGGFGEVWLAEQEKLRQRRVFKFCFDEDRLRSFKRELTFFRLIRDALGEREDIARLYDVKLDEPPFFLESEFAERGNLVEWCEAQGGVESVPLPRRLEIMARVAEAVAAAHSVGILHKDIKPQNVLMQSRAGGDDLPQLTDFGIGALADRSALSEHDITAAGFTQMTLPGSHGSGSSMTRLYAPPEQITGKVYTVQGDVYALGVMLYQIVVADFTRALAAGWERDVKDDLLREDIAACVDGDPARRLPSAMELAERLRTLDARHTAREATRRRAEQSARRRQLARLSIAGAAISLIVAVALGAGYFRERDLRHRASEAEKLSRERLGQAEKARDAAEDLVSKAIFSLREKLVPIGKIAVLEDMAKAAEDYYAKLPPELRSDVTRHHEVLLALNRAIIAAASDDSEGVQSSVTKTMAMSRALEAQHPADNSLREDQYFALSILVMMRIEEDDMKGAREAGDQLRELSDRWSKIEPNSPGALRALLEAKCTRLLAVKDRSGGNVMLLLPLFIECQEINKRLRQIAGETQETQMMEGIAVIGKAMVMAKMSNTEGARQMFAQADAIFATATATGGGHAFIREVALHARTVAIGNLEQLAFDTGNEALAREAYQQKKALVGEWLTLTQLEPGRPGWWKSLAFAYLNSAPMIHRFEGADAAFSWLEKGLVASEHTVSPHYQRPYVRVLRTLIRLDLSKVLQEMQPEGWETRALKLLSEAREIELLPDDKGAAHPDLWDVDRLFKRDEEICGAMLRQPNGQDSAFGEFHALTGFAQKLIDSAHDGPKPRQISASMARAIAALLLESGHAEDAKKFTGIAQKWDDEVQKQFADDPEIVRETARRARQKSWDLRFAVTEAAPAQKAEKFPMLEAHVEQALKFLEEKKSRLGAYDFAFSRGDEIAHLGEALLDLGRYSEAEAALSKAAAAREEAATAASDPNDAAQRRWDSLDSRLKTSLAILKQGRKDDGRKVACDVAAEQEILCHQHPTSGRLRDTSYTFREYAKLLETPAEASERFALRQKAAALIREAIRMAMVPPIDDNQLTWSRGEATWTLFDLATSLRETGQLSEAEATIREATKIAEDNLAASAPGQDAGRASRVAELRCDLAGLRFDLSQPDDAREQLARATEELRLFEERAGHAVADFSKVRTRLQDLLHRQP